MRRALLALLALVLVLPVLGLAPRAALQPVCAGAAAPAHASLVVEHQNGAVVRVCVGFPGPTITGEEMLRASGLEYGVDSQGANYDEVCQIDNEPATYDPNECLRSGKPYWSLWVSRGGGVWSSSSLGASSQTFADGDAAGWHFDVGGGTAPPSPGGVCPPPTPTPAATPATAPTPASGATPAPHPAGTPHSSQPAVSATTTSAGTATGLPSVAPDAGAAVTPTGSALAVAVVPSDAVVASPTSGPVLRSGPALAQPPASGGSPAGWILLGLVLVAAASVLVLRARTAGGRV